MHHLIHHPINKKEVSGSVGTTHSKLWAKLLYRVTIAAGIISPIMVLPQIYKIYSTHAAAGVSALSWFAFALLDLPFIIYGLVHKEKPIVITYTLFFVGNIVVAIGAVVYS